MTIKQTIHITNDTRPIRIQHGSKWIDIKKDNFNDFEILASNVMRIYPCVSNAIKLDVKKGGM